MQTVNAFGIEAGWICKAWEEKQHPRDLYGKFTHAQVQVRTPWGQDVEVDREIAPTIKGLWDHGIWTFFSCQGSPKLQDKYHVEGEHDVGLGYVFMADDGKWSNLVSHWAHSRDKYPSELRPLIDRINNSNIESNHWEIEWDEDEGEEVHALHEKVIHQSDSPWRTELEHDNPLHPKSLIIRFPKEDGKLLAKLLAATPRQRRDT